MDPPGNNLCWSRANCRMAARTPQTGQLLWKHWICRAVRRCVSKVSKLCQLRLSMRLRTGKCERRRSEHLSKAGQAHSYRDVTGSCCKGKVHHLRHGQSLRNHILHRSSQGPVECKIDFLSDSSKKAIEEKWHCPSSGPGWLPALATEAVA